MSDARRVVTVEQAVRRRHGPWLASAGASPARLGLSLLLARRHYPETALVTDSAGKALLVDTLGLSFTSVSTELDCLRDADPDLWALGKLVAYSIQDEPFIHLDTDVFLWRALPARLTSAPVLAQHREQFDTDSGAAIPG